MIESKLQIVEGLVDELDPADQVRLLQYLAPRIAKAVTAAQSPPASDDSWQRFKEAGAQLAALDLPGNALTDALSEMRR